MQVLGFPLELIINYLYIIVLIELAILIPIFIYKTATSPGKDEKGIDSGSGDTKTSTSPGKDEKGIDGGTGGGTG